MDFFATFGQSHLLPDTNEPAKDYYVRIIAGSYEQAKEYMDRTYGNSYSMIYTRHSFQKEFFPKGIHETVTL